MHLTQLTLNNFRNYTRLAISLPCRVVVLQGDNAQGKTNFLEAIHYLMTGHAPLASSNQELINWLADEEVLAYARLEGRVQRRETSCSVAITLMKEPTGNGRRSRIRRQIELNGVEKTATEFLGELPVVLFSPDDIRLVDGSPGVRRRFLDLALCQLDQGYCRALRRYNAALIQRNSLLRRLRRGPGRPSELDVWDEQLAQSGAYLIIQRWEALGAFDRLSQPFHRQLTDTQERLRLSYEPSFDPTEAPPVDYQLPLTFGALHDRQSAWSTLGVGAVADAFLMSLGRMRRQEIDRGVTCIGPQRDDFHFLANGVDMTTYGSRGQQRTVALSLQLAKRALMQEDRGEEPVLLLDDIMSELDKKRRTALMDLLSGGGQVILTTTSWGDLQPDFLARAHCLSVRAGEIGPAEPEAALSEVEAGGATDGQTAASAE